MKCLFALVATVLLPQVALQADVKLAAIFQNHLILQRGQPCPVWGSASPGEKVSVSFAGQTESAVAGPDGAWRVRLKPLAANATPATLEVTGNNQVHLQDVLVGEVWLCSGQSNMDFALSGAKDAAAEIAAAKYPNIRQFTVKNALSFTPNISFDGWWINATPETAGKFTAVGYFFAREMQAKLGVPIGLIRSTWGGTDIEAWMSGGALTSDPNLDFVGKRWQARLDDYPARKLQWEADVVEWQKKVDDAKAKGETYARYKPREPATPKVAHMDMPSGIFNAMIAPLVTYPIRGVLWYQGENNASRAEEYGQLFPALIKDWRQAFRQPELPFFWVQLPNYNGNQRAADWLKLRLAQAKALPLPKTGQAIAIDVGDPVNIHPTNKQPVGERLARLALHRVYGQKVVDSGPQFATASFKGDTAKVDFTEIAGGLKMDGEALTGFEVAGADRKFVPATARIDGTSVLASAAGVPAPAAVRYAWQNAPAANLYNSEHLPAVPFRSDDWP